MPTGTGKVKWFNNAKGYGFVLADEGGEDLFVHYSSIQMEGYKTLKAGQAVSFDMVPSNKGFHAVNIQLLNKTSDNLTEQADKEAAVTTLLDEIMEKELEVTD